MHLHQSVVDIKTGDNIFSKPDGTPSDAFSWFLGGQQTYVASAMCILAPYVNSYRRLVPDQSAPINLEWAMDNRSVGLRIPVSGPEARRIENRVIGMDCNPYLAIAACLACGLLGLKHHIEPRAAFTGAPYEAPHALPRNVLDALERMQGAPELQEMLGVQFCNIFMSIKQDEYNDFLKVVSPWEREHLMLNV
jgi:glutamine synthetase